MRIPAGEIEGIVVGRIGQLISNRTELMQMLAPHLPDAIEQQRVLKRAAAFAAIWTSLARAKLRQLFGSLIQRIDVSADHIDLHILPIDFLPS